MIARFAIGILSLLLLVAGPATAQQDSGLTQVVTIGVKPGTNAQFEEFVRALRDASREQGLENYWLTTQSVSGEPSYTFNLAMSDWSVLENAGPQLAEVFGEREAERLEGLVRDSVVSVHTAFYQTMADLSVPRPPMETPPAAIVYSYITLNAGMAQQYIEGSRRTREASQAVTPDSHYIVQMPDFGATSVRVVGILDSWSDLNQTMNPGQRVIAHYGQQEGGEIIAMVQETIGNLEVSLNRTRPDLNYQPGE